MPKSPTRRSTNYLRAWRERAGLTQEQLAEKVGTSGNVISLLESGDRGLGDKWLRKLAPVLGTTPGILLDHHPDDAKDNPFVAWNTMAPEDKALVHDMIESINKRRAQRG
jgi:transcriptional regulator with XRE-family HTH domain